MLDSIVNTLCNFSEQPFEASMYYEGEETGLERRNDLPEAQSQLLAELGYRTKTVLL